MSWTTSPTTDKIYPSLIEALGKIADVAKGKEATVKMTTGGQFSYRYADLADVIATVRPTLSDHGLAAVQAVSTPADGGVLISTRIIHTSGEWLEVAPLLMNAGKSAQEMGSAITYGRRYTLLACLGLAATEDDDDGAAASAPPQVHRSQQSVPPTREPVTPPAEPRSEDERYIRQIIAGLPSEFINDVRRAFKAKFGPLSDLDLDRHGEALTWTMEVVAQIEAHLAGGAGSLGATTVANIVADATTKLDPSAEPTVVMDSTVTDETAADVTPAEALAAATAEEAAEPATKSQLTSIKALFRGNKTTADDQLAMVSELIKHPITDLAQLTSVEAEYLKKIL